MSERPPSTDRSQSADVIRSSANSLIKYVRSLGRRNQRRQERAFVVEGIRAVEDALAAGISPRQLLLREGFDFPDGTFSAISERVPRRVVATALFDDLANTVHPQGVLAVLPFPELSVPETRSPLYLVVDGIRDPGNLGTLIRSAAAAGATAVFIGPGTVDPYNAKVVRAGMGAHFRIAIRDLDEETSDLIRERATLRVVARLDDLPPHDALDWRQPAALIVTGETGEESDANEPLANAGVAIPMAAGVDSLNAAIAGSVILFEAARQRRRGPRRGAIVGNTPEMSCTE